MKLKVPSRLSQFPIDWPNHVIGFFSALFGILIAFELDQWRERKQEEQIALNAFNKLKLEVQINNNSLHEMVTTNQQSLSLMAQKILPLLNESLQFIGTPEQADSINSNPDLVSIVFVDTSDQVNKLLPVHIVMGNMLQPIIHNSAWESAKATGALNFMDYEQVLSLSSLYGSPRITDELGQVKKLIQTADQVASKSQLTKLLRDLKKAHAIIDQELTQHDSFVSIIGQME